MTERENEQRNAEIIRRYLRIFTTKDLDELRAIVAEDVEIYGAGKAVRGREYVEGSVLSPGLTVVGERIVELFAAGDRVTLVFELTYRRDSTGATAVGSGCKMYRLADGKIVQFWGDTDLFGLLRDLEVLPATELEF
jgi:ketosteroid isomerase-like protein